MKPPSLSELSFSLSLLGPPRSRIGFSAVCYAQALTLAALPELPLVATVGMVEALSLATAVLEAMPVLEP